MFSQGRSTSFQFESFDLINDNDLSKLEIITTSDGTNCYIRTRDRYHKYESFILDKNSKTVIVCNIVFYPSSNTGKYIPRLTFKKTTADGTDQIASEKVPVNINLANGDVTHRFWMMINFLNSFKSIVDTGEFEKSFAVISSDYTKLIAELGSKEKVKAITNLIKQVDFSTDDIKSILFESRKLVIKKFLWLLKNKEVNSSGKKSRECYKEKYSLKDSNEAVWHHFLKNNDWILGLCADFRFIREFIDEAKVGIENTEGKGSPKVDMIGISNYTTLIELKTSDTKIFKCDKGSKSRANTWEFSSDFISGISQCLGQKVVFDSNYDSKEIVNDTGEIISNSIVYNRDVKSIFIIGCRYEEFPHVSNVEFKTKSTTFELFRRNNRNVEVITYDELFERAYHIVFSDKIDDNWYTDNSFEIKAKKR